MSGVPPATVTLRRAVPADFPEVRSITRDAYLRAAHFTADHPYMSVLEDVEHRAEHAQVWVAEADGRVVAAVTLTFAGQPYSEVACQARICCCGCSNWNCRAWRRRER